MFNLYRSLYLFFQNQQYVKIKKIQNLDNCNASNTNCYNLNAQSNRKRINAFHLQHTASDNTNVLCRISSFQIPRLETPRTIN